MAVPNAQFRQQCPTCETMILIKDERQIGKKMECPRCKDRFVVRAPTTAEVEELPPLIRSVCSEQDSSEETTVSTRSISQIRGPWTPGTEVSDHYGNALPSDLNFFVSPPSELGPICSAFSTLQRGVRPVQRNVRILWTLTGAAIGMAVGLAITWYFGVDKIWWGPLWGFPALFGACGVWAVTKFSHCCSYVGRNGIARFRCAGESPKITTREVMAFHPGLKFDASVQRRFKNDKYESTFFRFAWADANGTSLCEIKGSHQSKQNCPPMDNDYCWGTAAEAAWLRFEAEVKRVEEAVKQAEEIQAHLARLESTALSKYRALRPLVAKAEAALDKAEHEFVERAFAPFWDEIENATKALAAYRNKVTSIKRTANDYQSAADTATFPVMLFSLPLHQLPDARPVAEHLAATVRNAQRDFQFATIYEQRKTNKLLIAGFSTLASAIYEVGEAISSSLNDLSRCLDISLGELVEATNQQTEEVRMTSEKHADLLREQLDVLKEKYRQ